MGTLVCFHAHPDDEAISDRRHDGPGGGRGPPGGARRGHERRARRGAGRPRRPARRWSIGAGPRPAASAAALGVDRIVWLGYADSGMTGWEQNDRPGVVPPGRRRRGGGPPGRRPPGGGGRRPHDLRLARQLRPPGPRQGPPRRAPGRGAGRHAAGARGDHEPGPHRPAHGGPRRRRARPLDRRATEEFDPDGAGRRRQPVRHGRGRHHAGGRRRRRTSAQKRASIAAHRSQVTDTVVLPRDARGGVPAARSAPSGSSSRASSRDRARSRAGSFPEPASASTWSATVAPRPAGTTTRTRRSTRSDARQAERLGRRGWPSRCPAAAPVVTSPLRRCRETAAPLAARWGGRGRGRAAGGRDPLAGGRADGGAGAVAADRHGRAMGRSRPSLRRPTATRSSPGSALPPSPTVVVEPLRGHQRGDRRRAGRRPARAALARQLLGHGRRRRATARLRAGRGRPRGRHAHPLTGQDGASERSCVEPGRPGAAPALRPRRARPSCPACCGSWASAGSCSSRAPGGLASEEGEQVVTPRSAGRWPRRSPAWSPTSRPTPSRRALAQAQGDGVRRRRQPSAVARSIDCGKAVAFFVEQPGRDARATRARPPGARPRRHARPPTRRRALTGTFTMTDPHTRTKAVAGHARRRRRWRCCTTRTCCADLGPATVAGHRARRPRRSHRRHARRPAGAPRPRRWPWRPPRASPGCCRSSSTRRTTGVVRADLLEGAALAGRVLQRTGPGPHQALAQLVGGRTGRAPRRGARPSCCPTRWPGRPRPTRRRSSRLAEALGGDDVWRGGGGARCDRLGLPDRLAAIGVEAGRPRRRGPPVPGPSRAPAGGRQAGGGGGARSCCWPTRLSGWPRPMVAAGFGRASAGPLWLPSPP